MSDYTPATEFVTKDSLAANDPDKKVVGSELDAEFDAIATAIATKLDAGDMGLSGGPAVLNSSAKLDPATVWDDEVVLAIDTSATTPDAEGSNVFVLTLTENITVNAPTLPVDGQTFRLIVVQDGTGSRTITWNAIYRWPGGTAPTLTTTAGKADVFEFTRFDANDVWIGSTVGLNYTVV
jgi:hypothetical protein